MSATTPSRVSLNPFLPLHEYIPDGEPHVFGDRVYLFGSHDREGGETYCELDYVFYSAPVDDLTDWTCKGVSYRADQDPGYAEGRHYLFAPDVVQGNDGRYYLYYGISGPEGEGGYFGPISVAVADEPDGAYEYLGFVKNPDGTPLNDFVVFDPALINDDGVIRMYYGAGRQFDDMPAITRPFTRRTKSRMYGKSIAEIKAAHDNVEGAITVVLDDDMMTVRSTPTQVLFPRTKGTPFEGHRFFEASAIRKINGTYYLVYSSQNFHELCYATSAYPDRDFVYRGTIVSNGDIGLDGRLPKDRVTQTGTNHGCIELINGQWYVFYHRNTHGSLWSRQSCAEKVEILPDGSIPQVPITSSGLNVGALPADRTYSAVIACHLTRGEMGHGTDFMPDRPVITNEGDDRFIGAIGDGTTIGFKYFAFTGDTGVTVTTRGTGTGHFEVSTEDGQVGTITVAPSQTWTAASETFAIEGDHALYLRYVGDGSLDLLSVGLE